MAEQQTKSKGVIEGITSFAERFVPDSYVILLLLTMIAYILALGLPFQPLQNCAGVGAGFLGPS